MEQVLPNNLMLGYLIIFPRIIQLMCQTDPFFWTFNGVKVSQ